MAALPAGRVSFQVQRLEPQVALALGGFTVWSGVFLNPPGIHVWLMALYAGAIGGWVRAFPARRKAPMLARAALLLLGGFVLHTGPGLGGPVSLWAVWPLVIATGYCMLLPRRWATALIALTVLEFAFACLLTTPPPPWQRALALAGSLWFVPAMALDFGRALRTVDKRAEQSQTDRRTHLYNEDGFFINGGELFDECRRGKRPFTLVLLSGADLRDASELLGKKAANKLLAQLVSAIGAATPPGALAARTDSAEFAVAMPGLTAERAESIVHQRLGEPPQVEIEIEGAKATVLLDVVIAEAAADAYALEDLYDRLRLRLRERSRPSRTTPGEISTLRGLLERDPPMPMSARPTLPMSLQARDR